MDRNFKNIVSFVIFVSLVSQPSAVYAYGS